MPLISSAFPALPPQPSCRIRSRISRSSITSGTGMCVSRSCASCRSDRTRCAGTSSGTRRTACPWPTRLSAAGRCRTTANGAAGASGRNSRRSRGLAAPTCLVSPIRQNRDLRRSQRSGQNPKLAPPTATENGTSLHVQRYRRVLQLDIGRQPVGRVGGLLWKSVRLGRQPDLSHPIEVNPPRHTRRRPRTWSIVDAKRGGETAGLAAVVAIGGEAGAGSGALSLGLNR